LARANQKLFHFLKRGTLSADSSREGSDKDYGGSKSLSASPLSFNHMVYIVLPSKADFDMSKAQENM
jgi:hypothetical protein